MRLQLPSWVNLRFIERFIGQSPEEEVMAEGLITLNEEHGEQLEQLLSAFDDRPDELHAYFCRRDQPIEEVAELLSAWERDEALPEGWVGSTTRFWGSELALKGIINIRHELTPALEEVGGHIGYCVAPAYRGQGVATAMLRAAVQLCRERGIERVLVTCDTDNLGSRKVIERCGGRLEREGWSERAQATQRWYRIG